MEIVRITFEDFLNRVDETFNFSSQTENFEERAAILEYDGGLSRKEAEIKAKELCNEHA